MHRRRGLALVSLALILIAATTVPNLASASGHGHRDASRATTTLLDWQLLAIDTVYVDGRIVLPPVPDPAPPAGPVPIPVGTLFLGYTALAVHDAVRHTHGHHASR